MTAGYPHDRDWGPDEDGPGEERPREPYWAAGHHLPPDALRMGLTHQVPDGALLDFAGRLDATKLQHRITAWVMLVVFGMPVLIYLARVVQALLLD